MIPLLIAIAAGITVYFLARNFVRRRLRFVDAVQSPFAPILAGATAALVAWPLALLPFFTTVAAVIFGIGAGLGTASGARNLRHAEAGQRRLTP
jgi:hypothetical protein